MYFYKNPTCKSQVQNTSRTSLVNIEYDLWNRYWDVKTCCLLAIVKRNLTSSLNVKLLVNLGILKKAFWHRKNKGISIYPAVLWSSIRCRNFRRALWLCGSILNVEALFLSDMRTPQVWWCIVIVANIMLLRECWVLLRIAVF